MNGFDENLFEAKQVFYASKDGTRIPMFVMHKKVISQCYADKQVGGID